MSRITKTIAEEVAKKLTEPKYIELKALKLKREKKCSEFYIKTIPVQVLELFKEYPAFIRTTSSIRFAASGIEKYNYYSLESPLPGSKEYSVTINQSQSNLLIDLDRIIEDKNKELNKLRKSIEIALINLRTYNNVEKEFPEAFKILPKSSVNMALTVNLQSIRCKLDKANCK